MSPVCGWSDRQAGGLDSALSLGTSIAPTTNKYVSGHAGDVTACRSHRAGGGRRAEISSTDNVTEARSVGRADIAQQQQQQQQPGGRAAGRPGGQAAGPAVSWRCRQVVDDVTDTRATDVRSGTA